MAKDNIIFPSLITLDKSFSSNITKDVVDKSVISDALVFESVIGIESIIPEYSNGIVSNAIFGEVAVFDFDVVANFSGDVVFTVNWGIEVGVTIINATLLNGVSQPLQTSILIPEGVNPNQTINVTDSLGGVYQVGYTVEGSFIAEYQAVYDNWIEKPADIVAAAQNAMVEGWVNTGVWALEDRIFVFAAHTNDNGEALDDWKNPGVNFATLVNGPTFTPFEGFKGDGATQYVDTNYNAAIDGVNYVLNSSSYGIYSRTNLLEASVDIGSRGAFWILLATRFTGDLSFLRINNSAPTSEPNLDSRGMYIASRTLSNESKLYKNKSILINSTQPSDGVPNFNIYIGCYNSNGTPSLLSTRQISLGFLGGLMTQQNVNDKTDYFEAYMDSNGKGVIP